MKTFVKYDFYFQLAVYLISILWSFSGSEFQVNFAICLFFIGCSQTLSFIIRVGGLQEKNVVFRIYTAGYCIFLLSILFSSLLQHDFAFVYVAILINTMAILFLISSFIDYKNQKSFYLKNLIQ